MVLGFRLYIRWRLTAVWWMTNMRSFCFIITFRNYATSENRLTYQCPSSWPVVITMKKRLAGTWKKNIGYWPVQINGNKFATGQILNKPVEVVKQWILAGWAQKSPEPWSQGFGAQAVDIFVFPSPTGGYMWTSFSYYFIEGEGHFLVIFIKLNRFIWNYIKYDI
jgi:hypothetical protein